MITLRDVVAGTGGRLVNDADLDTLFQSVWHDSRLAGPGDLFVALPGEHTDGHQFLSMAVERGATGAIVAESELEHLIDLGRSCVLVAVPDTLVALHRLAAHWRQVFDVRVVGITGSIGKSSTKEVVAAVAGAEFVTVKSQGSYNNEVGLPISILRLTPDTDVAVLEMGGAYRFGEITELAEIARPDIGVVTNVTHSHLSRMGSLEAIANTKVELVRSLPADGLALLNADDDRVRAMAAEASCRVWLYGQAEDSDLRAVDVESLGTDGIQFTLLSGGAESRVSVPLLGRHSVHMALVGIGVGLELGMALPDIMRGFDAPDVQLRLILTPALNGATILDDHYNANPASSNAALTLMEDLPGDPANRRLWRHAGDGSVRRRIAPHRRAPGRRSGRCTAHGRTVRSLYPRRIPTDLTGEGRPAFRIKGRPVCHPGRGDGRRGFDSCQGIARRPDGDGYSSCPIARRG